jgi:hypothetical protein
MRAYGNLKSISDEPRKCYEFEVLNELKDLSSRTDENCLFHTRFVFECDSTSLEDQTKRAEKLKDEGIGNRAVYSGSKSIHVIIEFDSELETICKDHYKEIWTVLNRIYFNSEADKACANPARLTRRPDAVRSNQKIQKLIYSEPNNIIRKSSDTWKYIWRCVRAEISKNILLYEKTANDVQKTSNKKMDGKCRNYDVVKYYLNKSYPKMTGNGDSSISLFKAIRCCMKYGDELTLNEVINKATREKWSMKEIERIQDQVRRKYL